MSLPSASVVVPTFKSRSAERGSVLAQCNLMTDPAQKGQCKRDAAQVYAASLQACSNQHATCVQACQSRYP